jgi:1-acyl-sn-glycerol-3-phosphate acyltransferase
MIRTLWALVVAVAATLFFGSIAIGASLLRVRGDVYSWATRAWSRTILRGSGVSVHVHGAEHSRWNEGQILVANHVSAFDILAIAAVIPTNYYFVAKKELECVPFFGIAWKAAGHISIDRSNRQSALASLQRAGEKIRRDRGTVVIFPEGTRSPTGELLPFKKGAFQLAIEAQVPVLPVIVAGSYEIMKTHSRRIEPRPIHLYIAPPVDPRSYAAAEVDTLVRDVHARMSTMLVQSRAGLAGAA